MPEIKQFFATNQFRADDTGSRAYETLGRRVGGQYGAAGNDIRDIGRMKAATINMLGRWPQNILELEKREAERAFKRQGGGGPPGAANWRPGGSAVGGVNVVGSRSSITDSQFAPRYMPNLAALNEMSEGARQFGSALGSGIALGYQRPDYPRGSAGFEREQSQLRRERLQEEREAERDLRLSQAAEQKRWDLYEKDLGAHNKRLEDAGRMYQEGSRQGTSTDYGSEIPEIMKPGQVENSRPWSDYLAAPGYPIEKLGRDIADGAVSTYNDVKEWF